MIGGRVERREIVVVRLDLRTLKHLKPHARKDVDEHIPHARHGVQRPLGMAPSRHGDVHLLPRQAGGKLLLAQRLLKRGRTRLDGRAQFVDLRPERRTLLRRKLLQLLVQRPHAPRLAQVRRLCLVQRMTVGRRREFLRRFL